MKQAYILAVIVAFCSYNQQIFAMHQRNKDRGYKPYKSNHHITSQEANCKTNTFNLQQVNWEKEQISSQNQKNNGVPAPACTPAARKKTYAVDQNREIRSVVFLILLQKLQNENTIR
jgi:hypothetical protein